MSGETSARKILLSDTTRCQKVTSEIVYHTKVPDIYYSESGPLRWSVHDREALTVRWSVHDREALTVRWSVHDREALMFVGQCTTERLPLFFVSVVV